MRHTVIRSNYLSNVPKISRRASTTRCLGTVGESASGWEGRAENFVGRLEDIADTRSLLPENELESDPQKYPRDRDARALSAKWSQSSKSMIRGRLPSTAVQPEELTMSSIADITRSHRSTAPGRHSRDLINSMKIQVFDVLSDQCEYISNKMSGHC